MKKRIVSIELLRMLAMMMVVMLHYLDKGGVLPALTGEMGKGGYVAWGLESLSIVAVNVYMLISGYFLVESGFKPGRLVELLCQVLFYTLLVPAVLTAAGILEPGYFNVYHILRDVLPVQMEQYWFITAYVIMYLFSPVLGAAAKAMKQEQLKGTIIALLLFFSVSKTILPVELAIDKAGNDGMWFLCMFLVAAYIRLYGIPFFAGEKGGRRGLLCYLTGCAGIYALTFAVRAVYLKTGSLDHFIKIGFDYNHVLNLLSAIGLFHAFLHWKIPSEGKAARVICRLAPYSLGVYLLHEQIEVRYLWPQWIGASGEGNVIWMVCRAFGSVALIYAVGTLVDAFRAFIFAVARKVVHKFVK